MADVYSALKLIWDKYVEICSYVIAYFLQFSSSSFNLKIIISECVLASLLVFNFVCKLLNKTCFISIQAIVILMVLLSIALGMKFINDAFAKKSEDDEQE